MNARELIIKIKALFSREGDQDLAKPIEDVTKAQDKAIPTTEKDTQKKKENADAAKKGAAENQNAAETMAKLDAAMQGNVRGLAGLIRDWKRAGDAAKKAAQDGGTFKGAIEQAGGSLGFFTAVAGAAWMGWNAGLKIQEALWSRFVDGVKSLGPLVRANKAEIEQLNQAKLDKLQTELDAIETKLKNTLAMLDAGMQRISELRGAQAELQDELIKAKEKDPDKQKAALEKAAAERDQVALRDDLIVSARRAANLEQSVRDKRAALNVPDGVQEGIDSKKRQYDTVVKRSADGWYSNADREVVQNIIERARLEWEGAKKLLPNVSQLMTEIADTKREIDGVYAHMTAVEAKIATSKLSHPSNGIPDIKSAEQALKDIGGSVERERVPLVPTVAPTTDDLAGKVLEALYKRLALEKSDVARVERIDQSNLYESSPNAVRQVLGQQRGDVMSVEKAIHAVMEKDSQTIGRILQYLERLDQRSDRLDEKLRRMPL